VQVQPLATTKKQDRVHPSLCLPVSGSSAHGSYSSFSVPCYLLLCSHTGLNFTPKIVMS
jgi:hypothetical protein